MTYKQLSRLIDGLTTEQQNQSVAINLPQSYPLSYDVESDRHVEIHGAVFVYGEDGRLDHGHFVVAI